MPTYFGYLRVSRDSQDVASQRLGLLDYANTHGYSPLVLVDETVSRDQSWRKRAIGDLLLNKAQPGDFILTPEFTRLGGSPGQVFSILETAAERGVTIIITKNGTVMDGSLNAQIQAAAFAMASMIEVEFTRARTREGLQRARLEGRHRRPAQRQHRPPQARPSTRQSRGAARPRFDDAEARQILWRYRENHAQVPCAALPQKSAGLTRLALRPNRANPVFPLRFLAGLSFQLRRNSGRGNLSACTGSMVASLRPTTILASARLSRHWPAAARLRKTQAAQYAAWP
jgi:putative DNA-invertase from lambdoid prophage Rac